MKKLSIILGLSVLATTFAHADTYNIDITSNTTQAYVNGASISATYDVVNVNVSDGVTLTNTNQRIVNNPRVNTVYNFTASGTGGTGKLIADSAAYNGLILGQASDTAFTVCAFNMDIDVVLARTGTRDNNFILIQYGTTASFLKNLDAVTNVTSAITTITGATVNFGAYDGTASGTYATSGHITLDYDRAARPVAATANLYSNYAISLLNTNKLYVKHGSAFNISGGTLSVGALDLSGSGSTLTMTSGTLNITAGSSATLSSIASGNTMSVQGGTVNWTGSSSSYIAVNGNLNLSGGNLNMSAYLNSGGVFKMTGGSYENKGTLNFNGGTLEYHGGTIGAGTAAPVNAASSIKLYADLASTSFNFFRFASATAALNLYLNGFDFTVKDFRADTGYSVLLNLIVEDGYAWENNSFRITNANSGYEMTEEAIYNAINSITINGMAVDKSLLNIVSDGGTGFYVNIIPEPAEWAAIFGALAIGIAIYRRKRR